ncbi:MAG: transferase [Calditrichaeota bacterium]|nr:transferase [Calditrichota bacterium]
MNNQNYIIDPNCTLYENVIIGEGSYIQGPSIIGKPPRGADAGELQLVLGKNNIVRHFTTIYAGSKFGNNLQTGQGASIRENNTIGDDVSIGTNSVLEFGNKIGHRVRIHSLCFLEMVTIEDDVFIGPNVVFTDDPHPMNCPRYTECLGGVIVKRLARIGAHCTILPGVVIGENTLIGGGSVVTKDIPDNMVAAGSPAKVIKHVDELKCYPGFFEKPYAWAPYQK